MTKENPDIHAVVLAGPGHRLYPLVDEASQNPFPKALLPLVNRPMICWTVEWLVASGVGAVTVVVEGKASSKINHAITKLFSDNPSPIPVDMIIMNKHDGTIAVLKEVAERLSPDATVILVPCDFVTNRPNLLAEMADKHRLNKAALTALLVPESLAIGSNNLQEEVDGEVSGEERGDAVIVAIDDGLVGREQIVFYGAKADVESDGVYTLTTSTILKHPKMTLRMDLLDVHCYIMNVALIKHSVFEKETIYSFREEALPRIVSKADCLLEPYIFSHAKALTDSKQPEQYCIRASSICSYILANKTMSKQWTGARVPSTTEISPRSQIGTDSLIGEYCRVGERSTVKKSVVGSHVCIGSNVKISNCVVLDSCIIEDGVKLDNCVIGMRAIVKERASLKQCEVAGQFTVEADCVAKGEVIGASRELQNMFD